MTYLIKVKGKKICVPRPGDIEDGTVAEITIKKVFVDETMKKRLDRAICVRF
jgi:hypothetical protein